MDAPAVAAAAMVDRPCGRYRHSGSFARGSGSVGIAEERSIALAWAVGVAGIVFGCAFLLAARFHTLHPPTSHFSWLAYLLWSLAQQFLLQDFFLARLQRLIRGEKAAALAAAGFFAAAHLPNPVLTVATLLWGFLACLLFLRYRNLYTIAVAHAILGITVCAHNSRNCEP